MGEATRKSCLIQRNSVGLYDLTVIEGDMIVETASSVSLKSAARIAVERLGEQKEGDSRV